MADAEDPGCADAAEDLDTDGSEAEPADAVGAVVESGEDSSVRDAEERVDELGPLGEAGGVCPEADSVCVGPWPRGGLGEECPEDDAPSAGADPGVDSPEPDADKSASGSPPASLPTENSWKLFSSEKLVETDI